MNEIKYSVLRFQIEELKNDNALLRAQLQQHGIEVNGDATPQWLWTGQVQDHKHRVSSSHTAERHQERSKKKRKEEITGDNFCLKLDQRNTQKAHEEHRRTAKWTRLLLLQLHEKLERSEIR